VTVNAKCGEQRRPAAAPQICGGDLAGRSAQAEDVEQDHHDGDHHEGEGEDIATDAENPAESSGEEQDDDNGPDHGGVAGAVFRTRRSVLGAGWFGGDLFAGLVRPGKFRSAHS
jgi:hypothetical protein